MISWTSSPHLEAIIYPAQPLQEWNTGFIFVSIQLNFTMKTSLFLTAFCLICQGLWSQTELSRAPFTIGETIEIKSNTLSQNRTLNVYLPLSYGENPDQEYPVIYLLDGSVDEDFIHIAGLVQFGSLSWINLVPESIVVGIGNVDRKHDYTFPTTVKRQKKEFPTTGGSADFIQYLREEVQPFIRKTFRTNGSESLIGQSLGGLLAAEILIKFPDMVDNYFIISPSLWWDKQSLLDLEPAAYTGEKSIYVAVGKEGKVMEEDAKSLYDKLQKDKPSSTNTYFKFLEKHNHGDVLHQAIYSGFEKVFIQEKQP